MGDGEVGASGMGDGEVGASGMGDGEVGASGMGDGEVGASWEGEMITILHVCIREIHMYRAYCELHDVCNPVHSFDSIVRLV
jgi:hypothetical protein